HGNFSDVEKDILIFIKHLETFFPTVSVVRQDERFTSKMAFNSLLETGAKKKTRKNKQIVDEISATLILQSYLSSNSKPVL
ncbi:MAG TPA: Holliday junction resolvase RuvX, partial [Flavobacteriaceae bacterium]|nr:Holliday junction resolvase RuvX [Flavobacteriaceae bacterium]